MSAIPFSFRAPPPLRTFALALAVGLIAAAPVGLAAGPFQSFIGGWSGVGQVVGSNGHHEEIRCRAEYSEAKGGEALNQTIVCASESFKLDIHSYVEASGDSVQGYWRESSRDVSGHITGRVAGGRFEGDIAAPTFTAAVSIISNGRTQTVSFQPHAGDISDVRIELKRHG
jgi:hypothetical protein